jgi:hypothetical protein
MEFTIEEQYINFVVFRFSGEISGDKPQEDLHEAVLDQITRKRNTRFVFDFSDVTAKATPQHWKALFRSSKRTAERLFSVAWNQKALRRHFLIQV